MSGFFAPDMPNHRLLNRPARPLDANCALTVLNRLAARKPDQVHRLKEALDGRLEMLAVRALDVAVETGDPIGQVLAQGVDGWRSELVERVLALFEQPQYQSSISLVEVAAAATERHLALLRSRCLEPDGEEMEEIARLLSHLGTYLRTLRESERARQITEEALLIYRKLIELHPRILPDFAVNLLNLSAILSDLGESRRALAVARHAEGIYRQLADKSPDEFLSSLAWSLSSLGALQRDRGDWSAAAQALEEAIEIQGEFGKSPESSFLYLAIAFGNLGITYRDLGYREDALDAVKSSVNLYRRLAEWRPDRFLPALAKSLQNLGTTLLDLGRYQEAEMTSREAVVIFRQLTDRRRAAFLADLARSLNNLGLTLLEMGEAQGALEATEESLELLQWPSLLSVLSPDLTRVLDNYCLILHCLKRSQEAVSVAREAVALDRLLVDQEPEIYRSFLAKALANLGFIIGDLDELNEAYLVCQEAAQLYRALSETHPEAFLPELARALNSCGVFLCRIGDSERALPFLEEAVQLYRKVTDRYPEVYRPQMAGSLTNLGLALWDLGCHREALQVLEESRSLELGYQP